MGVTSSTLFAMTGLSKADHGQIVLTCGGETVTSLFIDFMDMPFSQYTKKLLFQRHPEIYGWNKLLRYMSRLA